MQDRPKGLVWCGSSGASDSSASGQVQYDTAAGAIGNPWRAAARMTGLGSLTSRVLDAATMARLMIV